jgi:hypothetical protein
MTIGLSIATAVAAVAAVAAVSVVAFSLGGGLDHDEQDHLPPEWRHPRFERAAALGAPSR